ncbi:MAG: Malonyl CoA-acyl carrier protein transacylase [Candidatus Anoxychlamydiales bacterium]|nr:Malonyl CoA-acyl carrier protein transacylase [Candidatus Anoxychlamydiales bacterium]
MKKIAFIFPGQGSQVVSMGKKFYEKYLASKKIFDQADEILGYKISDIMFNGPEETLTKTLNSQLAIFINSVAILEAFKDLYPSIQPIVVAGLSLGEYSALYAANKISFIDAINLIKKRAAYMEEACNKTNGTMAAVLGLDVKKIKEVIKDIDDVYLANLNTPNQMVISGSKDGVNKACTLLKENGAKRAIELKVSGAFHSSFMKEAEDKLKEDILNANFKESDIDIVMNVTKDFPKSIENIKINLIKQISSSVRWYESINKMDELVDLFIEFGSKTLSSMNKKIKVNSNSIFIDKIEDLENLKEVL